MSKGTEHDQPNIELRSEEFHDILGTIPSWILRKGITIIAIILLVVLLGSAIFRYPDTITTTMTLTGTTPALVLVAKTSGKIKEFNISDKQVISKGEYLAIIENSANTKDVWILKQYLEQLNISMDTIFELPPKNLSLGIIQTSYSNFYITLFNYYEFKRQGYYSQKIEFMEEKAKQYGDYYQSILKQKDIINEQFLLNKNLYNRDSILNKRGVISNEELEYTKSKYLDGYLSLNNVNTTIQNTEIQITQMQESLVDASYEYSDKKNQLETQLKTYIAQLFTEIQSWELNYALISPIGGQVTFTNYWVENQNVIAGEAVFTIIPNNNEEIIGKAQMPLARSGKVKIGQKVNIRFVNFPDNEYGIVKGIVRNISTVPIKEGKETDTYIVEINLPDGLKTTYNKELPYLPEMQAQADIITEDMSLLERFFMPLRKIWKEGIN